MPSLDNTAAPKQLKIGRRELYILPTRIGWYYSLVLIALFAIAVKFDNQAAFMMLFILSSISLVTMLYTHNNVIGLELRAAASKPLFMGETIRFPIRVMNHSPSQRNAVWLTAGGFHQLINLVDNKEQEIDVELLSYKRGYQNCEPIILTSQYPMGLFFCWTKRFISQQTCLVYPQPLNIHAMPENSLQGKHQAQVSAQASQMDDYSGMKPYQDGDRMRDVHWPSLAKTGKLISIVHESPGSNAVNLSWFSVPASLGVEDRLSQLCHWVLEAEKNGLRYQLEMPNHTVQYGNGSKHLNECLSVLALWGKNS